MPPTKPYGRILVDKLEFFEQQIAYIRSSSIGTPKKLVLDLGIARNDYLLSFAGNFIYAYEATSITANVDIKVNEQREPFFTLIKRKGFMTPYYRLFLTNTAQAGETITFVYGTQAPDFLEVIDNTGEAAEILEQLEGDALPEGYGDVAIGAAAGLIVAGNGDRKSVIIEHLPTGVGLVYIGFSAAVTNINKVVTLAPGESYSVDDYRGDIWGIRSAGATTCSYGEV